MNAEEISKLINVLPNIIIYIVPGFIFIQTYNYILNLKGKELKNSLLDYILSSFLIITLIQFIYHKLNYSFDIYGNTNKVIICIISLFSSYFTTMFLKSEIWIFFMKFICVNRSNSSNIFNDIIDHEYGTWVRVYLTSEKIIYDGAFIKFEYKGSYQDSFVILADYKTYRYGESHIDDDWFQEQSSELQHVAIKVSDINRIEATYSERSKKVIKNNEINIRILSRKVREWYKSKSRKNDDVSISN